MSGTSSRPAIASADSRVDLTHAARSQVGFGAVSSPPRLAASRSTRLERHHVEPKAAVGNARSRPLQDSATFADPPPDNVHGGKATASSLASRACRCAQQPISGRAAQHTLPAMPPRLQRCPTRRTPKTPADQLSLDQRLLGAYDQHGCHLRHPESPPDAPPRTTGGLSCVYERAKPATTASLITTMNSTSTPADAQTQRRSTRRPAQW